MLGVLLSRVIRQGTLGVIWPDGTESRYGSGEPHAKVRLRGRFTPWVLGLRPDLAFGEAYMDGRLTAEDCTIADVLDILMRNLGAMRPLPAGMRSLRNLRRVFRGISQFNVASRSRRNVAHHYDLSGGLYDLFLDTDRQYSCAYFGHPKVTLEQAQAAKKRHIAAKLNLDRGGLKILDIGSGWGGMALELARDWNADVLGITLSTEQLALSTRRSEDAGLSERCHFALQDYRTVQDTFDRIVSVGMFEHVGANYYGEFFAAAERMLRPNGCMLLHTIGRSDGPGATNPWIAKYIFPGGYTPALSEIMRAVEKTGLTVTDVEVLRLHYAETLKEWRARFMKNRAKALQIYDERFCRMWEFYLAGAEMTFRHDHLIVFQIQLVKRIGAVPITRDYMLEAERAPRLAEAGRNPRAHEAA